MNQRRSTLATFLGTASLLTIYSAQAQQTAPAQLSQAETEVPEQVLVTGSLIRGAVAVGVPVMQFSTRDITVTGSLTVADLLRTVPSANVANTGTATNSANGNIERGTRVNIRGLDGANATRSLMMVDGVRVPPQGDTLCQIDPSIIPALAVDRLDILVDGASATYGSDAVAGVVNIILKRGYDGAISQLRYTTAQGGKNRYLASQLWGRTWDGGDITLSYEWYDESPSQGKGRSKFTLDYSPWGLDNRTPIGSSTPGTISTGAPAQSAAFGLGTAATLGTLCNNCWAIPAGAGVSFNPINGGLGPVGASSAATLNWAAFNTAANTGTNGVANIFNPYSIAWYDAAQQRNAATITVDQRLTKDISFFGEGFYSNRRAEFLNPATLLPTAQNAATYAVPTWNPYYPSGGAPGNLRVSYNFSAEAPSFTSAYELADRYLGGFNIELPGDWHGQIYYSETYDTNANNVSHSINRNAVSAALGWTIAPTAATGSGPSFGTWTKPATVPYLNLFCDPRVNACNADSTLNYVAAVRRTEEKFWLNEKGVKFDGPLFALPGGEVKAAVGGTYTSNHMLFTSMDGTGAPTLLVPITIDPESRSIWAVFAQVNVPVVGDANKLPGVAKLDLEASWRHDQYSDVGGTSNPKLAFTWLMSEDWGLALRGSWGTSFRAPAFSEISLNGLSTLGYGLPPSVYVNNTTIAISCDASGHVAAGSGADKLVSAGFGCGSTPAGLAASGGSAGVVAAGWRSLVNQDGQVLRPELATNWSVGADLAPTNFLKGLDLQATWYSIKINGVLRGFGNISTTAFNDGSRGFTFIVPSDVGCPASMNATPTLCAPFEAMVGAMLSNTRNVVPPAALTSIYWLNDGATFNKGWQKVQGVDWSVSYDTDLGDLGAWNVGMSGTYYLHNYSVTIPGAAGAAGAVIDNFHVDLNNVGSVPQLGVESLPRFKYRARLGWTDGQWSVIGFMDYQSHFYHTQNAPPNVNLQCTTTGGGTPGGTLPCAINNYSNIEPSFYTFDLSVGYDTGEEPSNAYLKNLGIQLVIQNLMDKRPAFEYRIGTGGGGSPSAYDVLKSDQGRTISLILTKTW